MPRTRVRRVTKEKTKSKPKTIKIKAKDDPSLTSYGKMLAMTSHKLPRVFQGFPDVLKYKSRMVFDIVETPAAINSDFQIKGNSFYLAGPNTNIATPSFAVNVPSGLYYLLSSSIGSGAVAPYSEYRILSSRITIHGDTVQADQPISINLWPSLIQNYSGMGRTQMAEQPRCVTRIINHAAPTSHKNWRISSACSTAEMYGLRYRSSLETAEYYGSALNSPTNTWYWNCAISTLDGATSHKLSFRVTVDYVAELYAKNNFSTSVPS